MQYKEFLQNVLQKLQDDPGSGYQFIPAEIQKNNGGVRHSLAIRKEGADISPCICMDDLFRDHLSGYSLDEIIDEIRTAYKSPGEERFDLSALSRWDMIRPKIRCRLVNSEKNEAMLTEAAHRKILDLSITYYVQVQRAGRTIGSIQVRNEHMGLWGVEEEDLHEAAIANRKNSRETTLRSMDETLEELFGKDWVRNCRDACEPQMYILGNKDLMHGAVGMLDKEALKKAAKILGKEFAILPSSIHEVLLVPATGAEGEMENYAKIVKEVNDTQVLPEEILSYHVYCYSDDTEEIRIAA